MTLPSAAGLAVGAGPSRCWSPPSSARSSRSRRPCVAQAYERRAQGDRRSERSRAVRLGDGCATRSSSVGRRPLGAGASARIPCEAQAPSDRTPEVDHDEGGDMSERLRPRDLAFLADGVPADADAQRDGRDLRPGRLRLRLRRAGRAHRRPDRVRAALPPAAAPVPGRLANPVWVDDPRLRPRLPRTPLRAAASRHHRPAARAGRPDHVPAARPQPPAVGGLLRRGPRGRPGRAALQVPPDPRRRRRDRRPRPGAARHAPRSHASSAHDDWQPAPAVRRSALAARARSPTRLRAPAHRSSHTARSNAESRSRGRRRGRAPGRRVAGALADRRPATDTPVTATLSQQRRFVTVRTDLDDYRRVRERARRHRQRRHPGHRHRRAARLADDPRRVVGGRPHDPGDGADVGHRRRARGRPRSAPRSPATCVDLPIGEASPVVRLHQVSYAFQAHKRDRPGRRRQPARRHRRLRADHLPRARLPGRGRRGAPRLPPRRHQRARPAVPAVRRGRGDGRDLPRATRCCPGTRWRSASRRTTAASSTASPPTATRVPDVDILGQCLAEALDELRRQRRAAPARGPRGVARKAGEAVSVRAYLPTTLDRARRRSADGQLPVDADVAVAAEDESEEAEYAALMTAADASAGLLERPGTPVVRRRRGPRRRRTSVPLRRRGRRCTSTPTGRRRPRRRPRRGTPPRRSRTCSTRSARGARPV